LSRDEGGAETKGQIKMNVPSNVSRETISACLELSRDPARYVEFFRSARAIGWNGQHLKRDPEEAIGRIEANIAIGEPWHDLPPGAQGFYRAVRLAIVQFCLALQAKNASS
jgi:hypothetical protein